MGKLRSYPLTSDQEEKRHLLEILSHPGRFLFLATLMAGEDALHTSQVHALFPGMHSGTFSLLIIKPLREAKIIELDDRGRTGAYYYIHPEASDLVQALLCLLFGAKESEVRHA